MYRNNYYSSGLTSKEMNMKPRRRSSTVAAALLILFTLSSLLFALPSVTAAPQGTANFSLRSLDGGTVNAESLRGKVVVLAFGATWLPLSRTQLQGIKQLADDYAGRNVSVYWVSTDSESPKSRNYASDDQIRAFANKYGIKVTVLRDPDGAVSKQFGVDQLPAAVILNKSGVVAGAIGGLDPNKSFADQVAPLLDKALSGQ
jgi:peroxiredoxin